MPEPKSSFITPLELEYIDGHNFRVTAEFDYLLDWKCQEGLRIRIPAGFVTDFASIPQVLWNILPPTGPYGKAAVVHDYLYRTSQFELYKQSGHLFTRAEADKIFYDAMGVLGTPQWKRWTIYHAVRTFGGGAYTSDQKAAK